MEKTFDCLKMKEEIQAKIYEEIKDMTFPELRAYYDKRLENNALWQRLTNREKAKQNREF
jgi:ribosome-binding factor A